MINPGTWVAGDCRGSRSMGGMDMRGRTLGHGLSTNLEMSQRGTERRQKTSDQKIGHKCNTNYVIFSVREII